ncbi:MAG: Mur ligase family protein, partial [Acidimicrobiia bacterium]
AVTSLLRWQRVSQREHYLPGSVAVTAGRWLRRRPPNPVLGLAWLALVAGSIATTGDGGPTSASLGAGAAVLGGLFPLGLSPVGSPRLRPTRRALQQLAVAAVAGAAVVAAVGRLAGAGPAAALAPVVLGLAVDGAAWLNRPLERGVAARFRRAADEKLARSRPRVVAVTGSYGKTTVKNHVRDLVGTTFDTLASPASWNNQAGLSRAVNEQLSPGTEVFVAEMGTYGPGEIRALVEWLRPEVAVITAIGPVHLERMRTLEAIVEAKAEILDGARVAVLCVDSPLLRDLADRVAAGSATELWRVGSDPSAGGLDVLVSEDDLATGGAQGAEGAEGAALTVRVRGEVLAVLPRGELHPGNVACAVAVASALGVDRRSLVAALPRLGPTASRSATTTTADGLTIVDDTFNSNPAGSAAALATLGRRVGEGRRVVVTPGMVELGPLQDEANQRFAAEVAASGAELVVVGWTNRRALLAGHPGAVTVRDREAARRWVRDQLGRGDGVLWENDLPDHYP